MCSFGVNGSRNQVGRKNGFIFLGQHMLKFEEVNIKGMGLKSQNEKEKPSEFTSKAGAVSSSNIATWYKADL